MSIVYPRFKLASPVIHDLTWGFVVFNYALLLVLVNIPNIPGYILTFHIWGLVFATIATLSLIGLLFNRWKLIRITLIMGVFIKTLWTFLLIEQMGFQAFSTLVLWLFAAFVQVIALINFPHYGNRQDDLA